MVWFLAPTEQNFKHLPPVKLLKPHVKVEKTTN